MRKLQRFSAMFAALTLGFPAIAAEVTLLNRSGRTLCAAEAMMEDGAVGESLMIKGWRCAPSDYPIKIELMSDDKYVSVVSQTMADFLPTQRPAFPLAELYAPRRWYSDYSIIILAKNTGGYAFTYQTNSGGWSEWVQARGMEDLDRGLAAHGFFKTQAWHLEVNSVPETMIVVLQ